MNNRLILIKHAAPAIDREREASAWPVSEAGRASCQPLARVLRAYLPARLFCSVEPKADQTARLLGTTLGLSAQPRLGLHEHDRHGAPYFDRAEDFDAAVRGLFAQPEQRVYGNESAAEALARFSGAIERALAETPAGENAIVVAHGTVITLFVAARNPIDPFTFWKSLKLPSLVLLTREGQLERVQIAF